MALEQHISPGTAFIMQITCPSCERGGLRMVHPGNQLIKDAADNVGGKAKDLRRIRVVAEGPVRQHLLEEPQYRHLSNQYARLITSFIASNMLPRGQAPHLVQHGLHVDARWIGDPLEEGHKAVVHKAAVGCIACMQTRQVAT